MPKRIIVFVVLAFAMAALFVRLGFWQLSRLAERRASNAAISAQMAQAEVPFADLVDTTARAHRRVVVMGTPDTLNEFVITGRSRSGSPGVWIMTPVRRPNGEAVLVNRGWVYAPDAATADLTRWRERRTAYHGYTLAIPPTATNVSTEKRSMHTFGLDGVRKIVPYKVAHVYVVAQDSGHVDSIPARLPMPVFDNGPHLNYAIQWFAFAIIALGGAAAVAIRARRAG